MLRSSLLESWAGYLFAQPDADSPQFHSLTPQLGTRTEQGPGFVRGYLQSAVGNRLQHLKRQCRVADAPSADAATVQSRQDLGGSSTPDPALTAGDSLRTAASAPTFAHGAELPMDPNSLGRGFSQPVPILRASPVPGQVGESPRASDPLVLSDDKRAAEEGRHGVGDGQRPQSPSVSELAKVFKGFRCGEDANGDVGGEADVGWPRGISSVASLADGLAEADKLHIRGPQPDLQSGAARDSACGAVIGSPELPLSRERSPNSGGNRSLALPIPSKSVKPKRSPELASHVLDLPLSEIEAESTAEQSEEEVNLGRLSNGGAVSVPEASARESEDCHGSGMLSAAEDSDDESLHMDRTNFLR